MKTERGMITLMTVFSGIAALMCLLVGLQLLSLESQIGQAAVPGLPGDDSQFSRWQTEVHTGAIMSLGAGVLVFLFGLRNHSTVRKPAPDRAPASDLDPATIDLESMSVRIFEIDEDDRSVEITSGDDLPGEPQAEQPRILWHPLDDPEDDPDLEAVSERDPADTILESIQEAAPTEKDRPGSPRPARRVRKSFLGRLFGR